MKITTIRKRIKRANNETVLDTEERLLVLMLKEDGFAGHFLSHFPTSYGAITFNQRKDYLLTLLDKILVIC